MEAIDVVKAAGALGLVLGLIAIAAITTRHFGIGGGWRHRNEKRLGVVEALTLDARRRVLLLRCDATEHLVLLGINSEVVLSGRPEAPTRSAAQHPLVAEPPGPEAPHWRPASRTPYRRDEPVLGPLPPRSR